MFFVFGLANGEKKINFVQTVICSRCGQFGRWEAYVTYMYFSLFFIPMVKWGKKYYIKSSCCNSVYEIDKELGKRIQRGEDIILTEDELHLVNQSVNHFHKSCPSCGCPLSSDFSYCPRCGFKI